MFRACLEAFDCSVSCHSEIYISAILVQFSLFNKDACELVYGSSASGSAT